MINTKSCYMTMLEAPARQINARVELFEGSTLLNTFTYDGALQNFTIDRIGEESKFFGYGICQKLIVKLRDRERAINIVKGQGLEVVFGVDCDYLYTCPIFFVDDVKRDENNNDLTITAYDAIYEASKHKVSELGLAEGYSILTFASTICGFLGMPIALINDSGAFGTYYINGANFSGEESLRDALNAIAEATQTIYYMNNNWELVFKRLDKDAEAALTIDKSKYFTLKSQTTHTLETIISSTELGDDVYATTGRNGDKQFIRDNPFWDLREDIAVLLESAIAAVGGLSITQFDCKWRGNFLLEVGDKINIVTKDNETITSYLLNDVITYNGGLVETTKWSFIDNSGESMGNPTTIGESIKQTYARVDKANKRIDLAVNDIDANKANITTLQLTTDGIGASVSNLQTNMNDKFSGYDDEFDSIRNEVSLKMSSTDVQIQIETELAKGVDKVVTSTGYRFDEEGMTVSKTGSEMTTTISEDGMTVYRNSEEVLTANNEGVKAEDLHATTYLIIGNNSRFEDFTRLGEARTGCFWIGG